MFLSNLIITIIIYLRSKRPCKLLFGKVVLGICMDGSIILAPNLVLLFARCYNKPIFNNINVGSFGKA